MPASPLVRSLFVLTIAGLAGCAEGSSPGDSGPGALQPLPHGVFEGTLQLAGEGAADVQDERIWFAIDAPFPGEHRMRLQTWYGYHEFDLYAGEEAWIADRPVHLQMPNERCVVARTILAERFEVVRDGEGVALRLDGALLTRRGTFDESYAAVQGTLAAVPDRTPPRILEAEEPLAPVGSTRVRFSEPVFFNFDAEVYADGRPVVLEKRVFTPATDANGDPWLTFSPSGELPIWPQGALPGGATLEAEVYGRDFAGHPLVAPATVGRVAELPAPLRAAGAEDDALESWLVFGAAGRVESAALPALEGTYSLRASAREPWRMAAKVQVPDTEAPVLRVQVRNVTESGWGDRYLPAVVVERDEVPTHHIVAVPRGTAPFTNEIPLGAYRGRTVVVSIGDDMERGDFWTCPPEDAELQLDGFTVVP